MRKVKLFSILMLSTSIISANVSGTVYKELPVNGSSKNTYGVKDSNEPGVAGVTVVITDSSGSSETVSTGSDGNWSSTKSAPVRVEFKDWPNYLYSAPDSNNSKTSIQFIDSDSNSVNFGLYNPAEYADSANPKVVTVLNINGSGKAGSSGDAPSIVEWEYNTNTQLYGYDPSKQKTDAKTLETGALWGLAYSKKKDILYSSAVVRRHSGFANGNIGDIYITKNIKSGNNITTSQWTNISSVGSVKRDSGVEYTLPDDTKVENYDIDAYKKVGRVGLGDIDLSPDEKTLYVMDLKNKKVIAIDTKTKAIKNNFAISDPGCNGDYRPWGISTHNNVLYVGVVCSAETSQNRDDLKAYVLKWNGAGFESVLNFPLNYEREPAEGNQKANWHPWIQENNIAYVGDVYAQPILSDIEFDETGAMILGFADRYGLMTGHQNYTTNTNRHDKKIGFSGGDILRACLDNSGWHIEQDATCGGITTDGEPKTAGPGGGEYYLEDAAGPNSNGLQWHHDETALGGLALIQGKDEVMTSAYDPVHPDTGGVLILKNSTGKTQTRKQLYERNSGQDAGPYMGKAGGIGDIEVITTAAPIEIGNRVWDDTNGNGIQDVNENGIAGVTVKLICGGVEKASATTDSNGNYIFSNDSSKNSTSSRIYGISDLVADASNCKIVIPNASNQAPLQGKKASPSEQGNDKQIDSNGVMNGNDDEATINSTDIINNHTFDFGFIKPNKACVGNLVWLDENKNGIVDAGEEGIEGVKVHLLDANGNEVATQNTNANGNYHFCGLEPGDYKIKIDIPNAYTLTARTSKNGEDNDSDINPATNTTSKITLTSGEDDTTWDAGLYKNPVVISSNKICIGNFVWYDSNLNGIQDSDELGVRDITVDLFDENGTKIRTSKTDNNGKYKFCNLEPNKKYKIKIHTPKTYHITLKDKGSDNNKDSDSNSNGVILVDKPATNNMSFDVGIYCDCDDYKVHPKKSSGSALNFIGLLIMMFVTIGLVRKRKTLIPATKKVTIKS